MALTQLNSIPIKELDSIVFGIFSEKEIKNNSVCKITSTKLLGENTVYDERMGTIEAGTFCKSCNLDCKNCVGHFGHIELVNPILHPMYYKYIINILKCICFHCKKFLLTPGHISLMNISKNLKGESRFDKILEKVEKIDCCCHCEKSKLKITFSVNEGIIYKQNKKVKIPIKEEEIKDIFDNISEEDVVQLGFDPQLIHPKNLIISVLPVLPPISRPYIITEGILCDDDLTKQYIEIVKTNNHLATEGLNEVKKNKYIQTLKFRIKTLMNNSQSKSRHSNGRPLKGIKERITGKEGLIRSNLMGKRCCGSNTPVILWNTKIKKACELVVGDVIIGDDGNKRTIADVFSGKDEMYKVTQGKGDDYIVNSQHILSLRFNQHKRIYSSKIKGWVVKWFDKNSMKSKNKSFKILEDAEKFKNSIETDDVFDISIQDYLKLNKSVQESFLGVKLSTSINWEHKDVKLDPYILGSWLGDGHSRGDGITSIDKEIVEYWQEWAKNNECCVKKINDIQALHYGISKCEDYKEKGYLHGSKNKFKQALEYYSLVGNKHIPEDYIINDKNTRLQLLAGIIDTDGSVEQKGKTIRITQSFGHSKIIDGVELIAKSLGFCVTRNTRKTSWTHKGVHKKIESLVLTISGSGLEEIPTKLERKRCFSPDKNTNSYWIKVESIGMGDYTGFEIDGNKRFLLSDFTITHNCDQTARTVIGPDPTLRTDEMAIPEKIARNLTVPERVNDINIDYLTKLVNDDKANYILKNNGETRINIKYAMYKKQTEIIYGDKVFRNDNEINYNTSDFKLKEGDYIIRNGEKIDNLNISTKRNITLHVGDVVERHLKNGDIVLLNRQPTLHKSSMLAKKVVIRPGKTFRFNLASCKSFNADFDEPRRK